MGLFLGCLRHWIWCLFAVEVRIFLQISALLCGHILVGNHFPLYFLSKLYHNKSTLNESWWYMILHTNLLHIERKLMIYDTSYQLVAQCFYLLIIAATFFGLRSWPFSGSLEVFRCVQHMCQLIW